MGDSDTESEKSFSDLLYLYYQRLFPLSAVHKWLCYGSPLRFSHREFSFTMKTDYFSGVEQVVRHLSFHTKNEFYVELRAKTPSIVDLGAIYLQPPKLNNSCMQILEKELVFDLDLVDYDEIRICCSGTEACRKCWKFLCVGSKIIDAFLREDFGFEHILWVFSGATGVYCWVADQKARVLDDYSRSAIAERLSLLTREVDNRTINLLSNFSHSRERTFNIIHQYFERYILKEQDILGTDKRIEMFTNRINLQCRNVLPVILRQSSCTEQRWDAIKNAVQNMIEEDNTTYTTIKNIIDAVILCYTYPRFDINASVKIDYFLRMPFSVHPETEKILVPIDLKRIDDFDPNSAPTLSQVTKDIDDFDIISARWVKKMESSENVGPEDFKYTSLSQYVDVFDKFLEGIQGKVVAKIECDDGA